MPSKTIRTKGSRGAWRPGRLPLIAIAVVISAGAAIYAMAQPGQGTPAPAAPPAADAPAASAPDPQLFCSVTKVRCGTVTSAGVSVSFAVVPANGPSAGLVLYEVGGPGANALARTDRDSLGLPAQLDNYDLLLINEPWVSQQASAECGSAMRAFTTAVATAAGPPAASVTASCAFPAWTQETYTAALQAIVGQLGRPLAGIAGHSYGALPAVAAAAAYPQAWLILNAPIAPPSVTGPQMVAQRMQSVTAALDRSYQTHCAAAKLDCTQAGHDAVNTAIGKVTSIPVAGRAQPLSKGDIAIAIIGALYGLDANATWLWTLIASLPQPQGNLAAQAARMADQMLMRYGDSQISERLAGFVKGTCGPYQQWATPAGTPPVLDTFFAHLAAQCTKAGPGEPGWNTISLKDRPAPVCILANSADPVTPTIWAQGWAATASTPAITAYRHDGHASLLVAVKAAAPLNCPVLNGATR